MFTIVFALFYSIRQGRVPQHMRFLEWRSPLRSLDRILYYLCDSICRQQPHQRVGDANDLEMLERAFHALP